MKRADLIAQLANMPAEMRERRQWLVWKMITKRGAAAGAKPAKVPFYTSGQLRGWPNGKPKDGVPTDEQPQVEQGHELDRAALVSFDQVLQVLADQPQWTGIGFAFLPGDGLIGVDIDGAVDLETGEISRRCGLVIGMCQSYTERSVSGTGMHIVMAGDVDKFKSDEIGLEVYCRSQYFTCTGDHWTGTPTDVRPADPEALSIMRGMVDQALAQAKAVREAAAAEKAAAVATAMPKPAPRPASAPSGAFAPGDDFKRVNDAALANLSAWVPLLFPAAKQHTSEKGVGYRVTSKDLGRKLQEDLAITPGGIKDFGEEVGKSPIDLVVQWGGKSLHDALIWLAQLVGVTLAPKRPARTAGASDGHRPEPPDEGDATPPDATAAAGSDGDAPAPGSKNSRTAAPKGAGGAAPDSKAKPAKPEKDIDWGKFEELRSSFALIYGTDTVWDGGKRIIMKIANMGHAHGSDMVRLWKGGKASPNRSDTPGMRWTVMPDRVVFDPTEACDADTHVNLFGGFPTVPKAGDVGPILELIKFLCSRAAESDEGRDVVYHWLLCWLAYPLQHWGAKLRTAIVMHGDEGAGKNFLTDTMVMMYGEYGVTVGQDELEDKFNDWRSRKMFVVGDEVSSRAELVHNKNRLKALITSTDVQINPKNLPRRTEANHINVVFNSNELQPLALDNSDRRYLVLYTPRAREFEFYAELGAWRAAGGVAAFYHFLLHYPLTGFDPFAPAPATKAKADLIDINRKSPERFWLEWSGGELGLPYRSCTIGQAYQAYLKYAQRTGDRFPVQQVMFTRMVLRISDTEGRPCQLKPMKVNFSPNSVAGSERVQRMLLVCEIPPDTPMGEWATDAWRQFDDELQRYLGRRSLGDGRDDADGEAA